jgi:hypothetical protein
MPISTIGTNGLTTPLPASNLGTPSAINLSNATSLAKAAMPSGSVLQVVSYEWTGNGSYNVATGTTTVATSITANITPNSTSSRVMILVKVGASGTTGYQGGGFTIYRNSTNLNNATGGSVTGGSQMAQFQNPYYSQGPSNASDPFDLVQVPLMYIDSPASTSALTYTVYAAGVAGVSNILVNISQNGKNASSSQIILMEIA